MNIQTGKPQRSRDVHLPLRRKQSAESVTYYETRKKGYNENMSIANIKIVLSNKAKLPVYSSESAAGADIYARIDESIILKPGERVLVPTGISMAIPRGYEVQIRPRSGLAAKNGITVLNAPGTIDSDYRGEIKVILINLSAEPFTINDGDRIAQMVVAPCVRACFLKRDSLDETERGAGGFGSTGV